MSSLFRRSFSRRLPDRLLQISDRIYVFDCCLSTSIMTETEYKSYLQNVVKSVQRYHPGASCMVFNFIQGDQSSLLSEFLIEYDMTVVDYPRHYDGYPLLPLEMIHYFLRSGDSWLSLEGNKNVILMHCESGGWPVLAFMLAALLLYRKQFNGEQKTLDMVYKQAPNNNQIYSNLSSINPRPSQLRYLRYVTGRDDSGSDWPPSDAPLVMDHVLLRNLPLFDAGKGCRPVVRVYGQDPSTKANRSRKLLFSSLMVDEPAWQYPKEECVFVKLEIHCHVEGDVFLECFHLYDDLVSEEMIFKVMFHTGFIQTNRLVLNFDEIDVPWDAKYKLSKDFKIEILLRDINEAPLNIKMELEDGGDKESHDSEGEFFEVEEIFTPMSETQEKKEDRNTILVQENNLDHDFNLSIQESILNDHDSTKKKDCTLHNGAPRWGSEAGEDDNVSHSKEIFDNLNNRSPASDAELPNIVASNIIVVDESEPQDVKVEIEPKVSPSVAKSKQKRNKWQEITTKTIQQQRVIAQWVPRSKAQVTEPTKPKVPVYRWVPKGQTSPKET